MSRHRKLATICAAIALPFGLAACGGGGGGGSDDAGTPPTPPPTYTVALPDGHGLNAGTTMLAHGDTVIGGTTLSCPSTAGCQLTVSQDPVTGAWSATATGGAVTVAVAPPPPGPDPVKLADAQKGARDAWRAARAALAGIAGKQSANLSAYQLAMDAVDDAKAAYDAALKAETVAEAERQQENAEAANETAQAQVAAVIASFDAPAIDDARMAAMAAAAAAKKAYEDAKAALDAVKDIQAMDQASYDTAAMKVAAAKAAYDAAKAAADAAKDATLKADALAQRDAAQDASGDASTANIDAMKYAGMVQAAEDSALTTAKSDAKTAYDMAKSAYGTAAQRVTDLETENDDGRAKKDDDVEGNYFRAKDALDRTKAAYDKAAAANALAQAATSSTVARGHADDVETHQGTVDTEKASVDTYAMLVETAFNTAQKLRDDEEDRRLADEQREKDVKAAMAAAKLSYEAAEADATKAEAQATEAEGTAPGTAGAMAARAAATAARMAATQAKADHDAITDDMTKAQADAKAADAASQASTANTQYVAAKTQNGIIQTAAAIGEEQRRIADIAAAKRLADRAVEAAETAKDNAATAATAAEAARDDAQAEYNRAMAARTDATKAKAEYEKAKAAAMAARAAADDAEEAYMAAKTARDGIDDDGTAEAAQTAQATAETKKGEAETAATTAETEKGKAETAESAAMTAANTHSLGLLMAANDVDETNAKTRAARITAVAGRIGAAAAAGQEGNANLNDNDSRIGTSEASATVVWDENVKANPDTNAKAVTNYVKVTITGAGDSNIVSETQNVDANNDGDFNDDGDTKANAKEIAGLPGFAHGQDITIKGTSDGSDRHVIVFTNKVQDTAAVTAKDAVSAKSVTNLTVNNDNHTVTKLGTKSGNSYTGVTFYELSTVSDDTDTRLALTGTLTCPSDGSCTLETDSNGKVTSISGYKFTGSRQASAAVTASDGVNNDYLVFGVWMDDATTPIIGAFANGATDFTPGRHTRTGDGNTDDDSWAALVGKATYNGAAAGLYTKGKSVDFFKGDATLTADFGKAPTTGQDTALGTITGTIGNIMAGGVATGDVINLNTDATPDNGNIADGGAFSGNARMGAAKVSGDVVTYPYNGTWSGQFRGPDAEDKATGAATLPPDVVGTFGVTGTDNMGTASDTTDDVTTSYVGSFGASR